MGDNQGLPEPNPNWNGTAEDTLGWLWPGHVYFFAALFIIVGLVTTLALVVNFHNLRSSQKYFVKTSMLCAVMVLSVSRVVMLLVDPYLSNDSSSTWWVFGCILITGFGTASQTASLAILLYVTIISTRITYLRLDFGAVVCVITVTNFVFFVTSDVVAMLWQDGGRIMLTICQITFAAWGILISTGFGILTFKLRRNARATFEQAKFNFGMKCERMKLRKLGVLLGILSVTATIFFVLRICEAISGLTSEKYLDSWSWWTMQTVLRTLEIINAIVLLLVFQKESNKAQRIERCPKTGSDSEKYTLKNISIKSTTTVVST